MNNPLLRNEEPSIQDNLARLSIKLGSPLDWETIAQLYQDAENLLSHMSAAPVTLARVAGVLLVDRVQDSDAEEVAWFRNQIEQCTDDEEVEETIESLHRIDTL